MALWRKEGRRRTGTTRHKTCLGRQHWPTIGSGTYIRNSRPLILLPALDSGDIDKLSEEPWNRTQTPHELCTGLGKPFIRRPASDVNILRQLSMHEETMFTMEVSACTPCQAHIYPQNLLQPAKAREPALARGETLAQARAQPSIVRLRVFAFAEGSSLSKVRNYDQNPAAVLTTPTFSVISCRMCMEAAAVILKPVAWKWTCSALQSPKGSTPFKVFFQGP